jgi:hypothetical protein
MICHVKIYCTCLQSIFQIGDLNSTWKSGETILASIQHLEQISSRSWRRWEAIDFVDDDFFRLNIGLHRDQDTIDSSHLQ